MSAQAPPVVYIFHGDDEYSIALAIVSLEDMVGREGAADLNINHLDCRSASLDEIQAMATTTPFLAARRLIVLSHLTARYNQKAAQKKITELLDAIPATTALVIREAKELDAKHWLLRWAESARGRSYVRRYVVSKGAAMAEWIMEQTRAAGGTITKPAASVLSTLVESDRRHAAQEIEKLLAYVNFDRPIDVEDVQHLSVAVEHEDVSQVFRMVDALGLQDSRTALDQLHQLLHQREPLSLFGMIVRQFRLLLLAREILDRGGSQAEVQQSAGVPPFVARKIISQARNFSLRDLEAYYRLLYDLDVQIKTGRIPAESALDLLVADLTPQSSR